MLCLLGACADRSTFDLDLDQPCADAGPARLLELGADEQVYRVRPFDDDRFAVSIGDDDGWTHSVVVSRCGGDEQRIAANVDLVFVEGDALLACTPDHDLVRLRDIDDANPTVLAERGCATSSTAHGLVAIDFAPGAEVGRLLLVRGETNPPIVQTLLDDLVSELDAPYFPAATETHAYGRTQDASAWEIDLATGERTLLAPDVADFVASERHIVYRPIDDTDDGESAVVLRDRQTGVDRTVVEAHRGTLYARATETYVQLGLGGNATTQWFWTDDLTPIEPPGGMTIAEAFDDGAFWLRRGDLSGEVHHALWRRGEAIESVLTCRDCLASARPDLGGVLIESVPSGPGPHVVSLVDDVSGEAVQLASAVTDGYRILADRRVLTVLDKRDPSPLVLHDHRDGSARTLVEQASPSSLFLTLVLGTDDDRDVVWVDEDPDEPRALYYARLADAE